MTSIPRPPADYKGQSVRASGTSSSARQFCFIVGLACIAGFFVDTLALALPPSPLSIEWRVGFLQQLSDRSLVLLFGSALLLYSQIKKRHLARPLSLICLGTGVAFILSCILIMSDSVGIKDQAAARIATRAEQLQIQIEEQSSLESAGAVTPELLTQATQRINAEAERLKQTTQTDINRRGLSSIGNLIVVGLGHIGLGRMGLRHDKFVKR